MVVGQDPLFPSFLDFSIKSAKNERKPAFDPNFSPHPPITHTHTYCSFIFQVQEIVALLLLYVSFVRDGSATGRAHIVGKAHISRSRDRGMKMCN